MYSVWSSSSFGVMVSQWSRRYWVIFPRPFPCRKMSFVLSRISSSSSSSSNDDSTSKKLPQLGYDPFEDLFGLDADLQPRLIASSGSKKSWFGPNGLYNRELPCPSCRGRGQDCSLCNVKGIVTCNQCNGDCVTWEESIDERPWEKACSVSPLKVKEDDEVDNLDIKLDVRRKTKRVYQSPAAEVNLKISRSLKLDVCRASMPIPGKRNNEKLLFRSRKSPEEKHIDERDKILLQRGSRSNYCPDIQIKVSDRRFRCRMCGERGHNRRTCPETKSNGERKNKTIHINHHCKKCGQSRHKPRSGL